MRALLDYPYPGNIRELENIIQHAVTMAEDDTVRLGDLPQQLQQLSDYTPHISGESDYRC